MRESKPVWFGLEPNEVNMNRIHIAFGILACLVVLFPPVSFTPEYRSSGNPGMDAMAHIFAEALQENGGPEPYWKVAQTDFVFIFAIPEGQSIAVPNLIGELALLGIAAMGAMFLANRS